jgi:hypothetical protein
VAAAGRSRMTVHDHPLTQIAYTKTLFDANFLELDAKLDK